MDDYDEIFLEERDGGIVLAVKAKPAARKNALTGVFNGALKVSVTTAPEKGKANKSIIKLLSESLDIPQKHISLLSGDTVSEKKFLLEEVSVADLRNVLSAL